MFTDLCLINIDWVAPLTLHSSLLSTIRKNPPTSHQHELETQESMQMKKSKLCCPKQKVKQTDELDVLKYVLPT